LFTQPGATVFLGGASSSGPLRVFIGNKAAKGQFESGTDRASAPYLRSEAYFESKIYAGLMWLDIAPGGENSADMGTKPIRFTA
jgi:hypothetical protein